MDPTEIILQLIGAFYVFAGFVAARAALTSHLIDVAISRLSMKPVPRADRHLTTWLLGSATIVLAGGLALLLLLDAAPWLFALSAAGQLLYLAVLGPYYFDREDPPDPAGRRQTRNAFVVYSTATLLVIWALYIGKLQDWREVPSLILALAGLVLVAFLVYLARGLMFRGSASMAGDAGGEP